MYIMSGVYYLYMPVRVDEVKTMIHERTGPYLSILATVMLRRDRFGDEHLTAQLVLWAKVEDERVIQPDDDFVMREVAIEGKGSPKKSPHKAGPTLLKAIWFDDPSNAQTRAASSLVMQDASLTEREAFLQMINLG